MVLVAVVGDLHYPNPRALDVLVKASSARPDLLLLAGDFLDIPYYNLVMKFIKLMNRIGFKSVAVIMGNHEHYLSRRARSKGVDSIRQVEWLAGFLEEHGVKVLGLGEEPLEINDIYLVGATGWYDYTLAPQGYSRVDFENCNPFGVSLRQLELCERGRLWLCPEWWRRDCLYVKLPISNEEYVKVNVDRVRAQLEAVPAGSRKIIVYHHVPRRELVASYGDARDFDLAYAGSIRLEDPVREYGVETVVYGHLHQRSKSWIQRVEGVTYANSYPYREDSVKVLVLGREGIRML
ncbi:MAG: metallophosphoesterase [Desulfurococcales archaeon]|nr:metallophosphoesterase [Desulfurococcales archaeon]